jgi:CheY-like chemotaxis protein
MSTPHRALVLVADDSPLDKELAARLLGPLSELEVCFASNGQEALETIERAAPAVVVADLVMPEIDGLELVRRVRAERPEVPVILMTAYGSEDVAIQALRAGAANYIAKKVLAKELIPTVRQVLTIAEMTRERRRILRSMVRRESAFVLESDPELINPLLKLLQEELEGIGICDTAGQVQIGVALQEALTNALFHGNLEVPTEQLQHDEREFDELACQRRGMEPYRSRRIRVHVQLDRDAARFVVGDDGPGFDTTLVDRPVQPDDLSRLGGRGLLLIRTFMDHVAFNATGSQITMLKFRSK